MKKVSLLTVLLPMISFANQEVITSKITSEKIIRHTNSKIGTILKPRLEYSSPYIDNMRVYSFYPNQQTADKVCKYYGLGKMIGYSTSNTSHNAYADESRGFTVVKNYTKTIDEYIQCEDSKQIKPLQVETRSRLSVKAKLSVSSIVEMENSKVVFLNQPELIYSDAVIDDTKLFKLYPNELTANKVCEMFGYGKVITYSTSKSSYYAYIDSTTKEFKPHKNYHNTINEYIQCTHNKPVKVISTEKKIIKYSKTKLVNEGIILNDSSHTAIIKYPRLILDNALFEDKTLYQIYNSQQSGDFICQQYGFEKKISSNTENRYHYAYIKDNEIRFAKGNSTRVIDEYVECSISNDSDYTIENKTLLKLLKNKGIELTHIQLKGLTHLDLSNLDNEMIPFDDLDSFTEIKSLNLANTNMKNEDILKLEEVKSTLKTLNLSNNNSIGNRINSEDLLVLTEMPKLKTLTISNTRINLNSKLARRLKEKGIKIIK